MVAGLAAHTDIHKAHEIANEVRRIAKQLKEAQTHAVTYNNRERLFGLPVTNVSKKYIGEGITLGWFIVYTTMRVVVMCPFQKFNISWNCKLLWADDIEMKY